MKKSYYSKISKRKSLASIVLAFLLTLSFNASPLCLLSDKMRETASAYKSTQSQTYYTNSTGVAESKFSDASYPSSLEEYFSGSNKNFNIQTYYNESFDSFTKSKVDGFFASFDGITGYQTNYTTFLTDFGCTETGLSGYYKEHQTNLNAQGVTSFTEFAEKFAVEGFTYQTTVEPVEERTVPQISTQSNKYCALAEFYGLLSNYINNEHISVTNFDDIDEVTTPSAFYANSTQYARFKTAIENLILQTAPIYAFDENKDTNVAAIIAKDAPATVEYNYISNSYTSYTTPYTNYVKSGVEGAYKTIYYFGLESDLPGSFVSTYGESGAKCLQVLTVAERELETFDNLYYRRIQSTEVGYVDADHPTYYKFQSKPYITSTYPTVYVLNDAPSVSDIDTYNSIYYKTITPAELSVESEYFLNIPYEDDGKEFFLHALYNSTLFNTPFSFETYMNYFVKDGVSKLYLKYNSSTFRKVFIANSELSAFNTANPNYAYTIEGLTPGFNEKDYVEVTKTSEYYVEGYKLYFEKQKQYYTETNYSYGAYETSFDPAVTFEMQDVPATDYELESSKRKIYVLSEESSETISSVVYDTVNAQTLEQNPNFYVKVPNYVYSDLSIDNSLYTLYYKHNTESAKKLYIVDDATNASENKIYKTLNYNIISSEELKNNYSNYVLVDKNDDNYNGNFQLYYKYLRSKDTSVVYVLDDEGTFNSATYPSIATVDLTDYTLIDSSTNVSIYDAAKLDLATDDIKLYYKLSNVFVQNNLKKGNAIYVLDSSLTDSEKRSYANNFYTPLTQSEIDKNPDFYVLLDTNDKNYVVFDDNNVKLYYKYQQGSVESKVVYSVNEIDKSSPSFVAGAYELITSGPDFVSGKELYYKKAVTEVPSNITKNTTYFYQTNSTVTLSSNSYYAISFYVNTIGANTEASFYIKDTNKVLTDIDLEHINTNGSWKQYFIYLSTDSSSSSTINLYLYLGDQDGIFGSGASSPVTGSVFFDDIKITKIGFSDFNKKTIDDANYYSKEIFEYSISSTSYYVAKTFNTETNDYDYKLYSDAKLENEIVSINSNNATILTTSGVQVDVENDSTYDSIGSRIVDSHNNDVILANDVFTLNTYDFKPHANVDVYNSLTWNDIFNFDNSTLQTNLLGKDNGVDAEKIENSLTKIVSGDGIDGYTMYNDSFTDLWRYYIGRDVSGQGKNFELSQYRQAYIKNQLEVTTTNQIKETEVDEDEKDDDATDNDSTDIEYVKSPFNVDNYALKLTNKNRNIALGITSNSFTIPQFGYYKVSLWVYSPDKDGKATISVNSILENTRNEAERGTLLSASLNAISANSKNNSSSSSEYGWVPVSIFIEGNNFHDQDCYLVLKAEKDCTVYFDEIKIEKITSAQYDTAASDSDSNTAALSLSPSSVLVTNSISNGNFDLINITSKEDHLATDPYIAESWTTQVTNSARVKAGIVSTKNSDYFTALSTTAPTETNDDFSNVYAIYAPSTVKALDDTTDVTFKHNYSIYTSSVSLSANTVYEVSFRFYKTNAFTGSMIANLYASSVNTANVVSNFKIDASELTDETWQTITFYISTVSSQTIYLEIGVEDASGLCYFKNVICRTEQNSFDDLIAKNSTGASASSTTDIYNANKFVKLVNLSETDFANNEIDEETSLYKQNTYTDKSENTSNYTAGQNGVAVATFYDEVNSTNRYIEIDKTKYYIGEVFKVNISDNDYFIAKTYNSEYNKFIYKLYSDETLSTLVTKIGENEISITTSPLTVTVNSVDYTPSETLYKLYKFADLTEEVKEIGDQKVTIESLDKVVVGEGSKAVDHTATINKEKTYVYHFETTNKPEFIINNTFISAEELNNAQSENVLILSNSYSTDYISLEQKSTKTIGTSAFRVLRIYVKTSDFDSAEFGLNISIDAINVSWTNINTTNATNADEYGYVCYEALIRTNSADSISNFGVKLSLGDNIHTGTGYAIISKISIDTIENEEQFEHYSAQFDESNTCVKKAIYEEPEKEQKDDDEDKKDADDKNSMSWTVFFYIFSSVLLVVTIVIAMVAIVLKKHPIKSSQKFNNEHNRDLDTISNKKQKSSTKTTDVVKEETPKASKPKDEGGII